MSLIPKRERSPTPPLTMTPKYSGVKFVSPLPNTCKKTSPNYRDARMNWLRSEVKILKALGLRVPKQIIRDDGMSLEWESDELRWPDSLQPANLPDVAASIPVVDELSSQNTSETLRDEEEEELNKVASELEDMAVDYLRKYIQVFDTDRSALAGAYSTNALFSYCVHEHVHVPRNSVAAAFFRNPSAAVHRFAPQKGSRNLQLDNTSQNYSSGPAEIVSTLLSLGPHKFRSRTPTDLRWNVLALQSGDKHIIFLSSHGDVTEEKAGAEKHLSFDQCFLLQKSDGSEIERDEWPLVAISHQLTVRDLSLRPVLI